MIGRKTNGLYDNGEMRQNWVTKIKTKGAANIYHDIILRWY